MTETDMSTLSATYACAVLTVVLISVRFALRYHRKQEKHIDDLWMAMSLVPLIIRLGMIHVVLEYGTTNFDHKGSVLNKMTDADIKRRVLGSKLILASRIFYAGFLWCMKVCILGFYERLTARAKPYALVIDITYVTLALTFVAVIFATLLECRPFRLYWQVIPDPGQCIHAISQLVSMGSLNIFTDLILILIPLPLVFKSQLPLSRKIQLFLLFGVGIFVVCITIIRMPVILGDHTIQKARTLWASIECFVACAVANAPVLNSFFRHGVRRHPTGEYNLHGASRRRRMPVTGQDSVGSLTRDGENSSTTQIQTEAAQKINGNHSESTSISKPNRSPWRGDLLATEVCAEPHQFQCPLCPPPRLYHGGMCPV